MKTAISWFEISTTDLDKAQAFYEAVLGKPLCRETMGSSSLAVFPYEPGTGVGGALLLDPNAPKPGCGGTLVYLDASPTLDAVLARVTPAGGQVALPCQALPPGMGFFAHFIDPDGNRVGLHALA